MTSGGMPCTSKRLRISVYDLATKANPINSRTTALPNVYKIAQRGVSAAGYKARHMLYRAGYMAVNHMLLGESMFFMPAKTGRNFMAFRNSPADIALLRSVLRD